MIVGEMILVSLFIRFVLEINSAQLFGGKIEKSYCLLLTTLQYIVYLDISQPRTGFRRCGIKLFSKTSSVLLYVPDTIITFWYFGL